jgi:hypothetical protein
MKTIVKLKDGRVGYIEHNHIDARISCGSLFRDCWCYVVVPNDEIIIVEIEEVIPIGNTKDTPGLLNWRNNETPTND